MMQDESIQYLTREDFATLFGINSHELPLSCERLINEQDFSYRILSTQERQQVILEVLKKLDSHTLSVSGEWRKPDWEKGWSENLMRFVSSHDLSQLVPGYYHPIEILRYQGQCIQSIQPKFQLRYFDVFRQFLFQTFFQKVDAIYEFGCGTGYNLAILAQIFPQKQLIGLDWTNASVELVNQIAQSYQYPLIGKHFDMFHPDHSLVFNSNSAVLTLDSLEQIGSNHEDLIQYWLKQKPVICVHVEPLVELYDENELLDYLAIKYHRARGYLEGFVSRLQELEQEGLIEILKTHRIHFGNQYHDGYSYIVWRPKP